MQSQCFSTRNALRSASALPSRRQESMRLNVAQYTADLKDIFGVVLLTESWSLPRRPCLDVLDMFTGNFQLYVLHLKVLPGSFLYNPTPLLLVKKDSI